MKKTITRDLVFTAAEVRDAILFMLRERDHPVPSESHTSFDFNISENGASLAWTETTDDGKQP